MIKPDDIKKHTAEFFTSDPDFVLWCLDPERAQDGYWCGYTERHPQDLVEFERAVSLVHRVGKTHPALPSVEKQLLLDRILTDHYARRRFAAPPRRRNRTALFAAASLLVAGVVAALFWSADFTGSGLPSAEAYENITLVTREGSREVYDDIARISLTPKGEILIDGKENEGAETDRRTPRQEVRVHTSELASAHICNSPTGRGCGSIRRRCSVSRRRSVTRATSSSRAKPISRWRRMRTVPSSCTPTILRPACWARRST